MAFKATQFADLPVTNDVSWDPEEKGRATLNNEILEDPPNWEKFRKAHLSYNPENEGVLEGYKLMVARIVDGKLTVVFSQLANRLAIINGARGGVDLPEDVKKAAFNHGLKYYDKLGIPKDEQPVFIGKMTAANKITVLANQPISLSDDNQPKWQQIALEGDYPGYKRGMMPFSLTRQDFDEIVKNFRKNPSYKAGSDGVGSARVVPWDFEHASEAAPTDGLIPMTGAPAQGWILELSVRGGQNGAELWALTEFLETAKEYISSGQYQWPSVSIVFDAVDPKTAENVGSVLTSVALTNQPFIQGMQRLVAKHNDYGYNYESATDASSALSQFKRLLGLPELAEASMVMGELMKLQQWITTGTTPPGISVTDLSSYMRRILNLPALTTEIETVNESLQILQRLIEEKAIEVGATPAPTQSAPQEGITQPAGGIGMDMEKILKSLSELLGTKPTETEISMAVEDLVELRSKAQTLLAADKNTNKVLLTAAQDAVDAAEKLTVITKALGADDPDSAVLKITELTNASKELAEMKPVFKELKKFKEDQEEATIQEEVAEVMASRKLGDNMKEALLLLRRHSPEKFAADFPKLTKQQVNLTQDVATKNGVQISVKDKTEQKTDNVINLSAYKGRNDVERLMSYLSETDDDFDKLSWDEKFIKTVSLRKQMNGSQ